MSPEQVQSLVREIERKDLSTAAHTWRVVLYARALVEEAGVDRDLIERITHAAALHDVGKIDIPDEILQKPGRLTPGEFEVIKRHAALGYDRLRAMGETDPVVLGFVRHHHERWDGAGYPDGLRAEEIPIGPRFFTVIDSFDAMTSHRPYRHNVGEGAALRALDELEAGAGTRYSPDAVAVFTNLVRAGAVDHVLQHFNDDDPDLPRYCGGPATRALLESTRRAR